MTIGTISKDDHRSGFASDNARTPTDATRVDANFALSSERVLSHGTQSACAAQFASKARDSNLDALIITSRSAAEFRQIGGIPRIMVFSVAESRWRPKYLSDRHSLTCR
jgi:hypothetical protein